MTDTSPEAERMLLETYRRMNPAEKLQRVVDLNHTVDELARARIRKRYGPDLSEREERLRLAALSVGRELMIEAFGWDPDKEGW